MTLWWLALLNAVFLEHTLRTLGKMNYKRGFKCHIGTVVTQHTRAEKQYAIDL